MSTTIDEVIAAGGYNLNTREDAEWLLGQESQFEELIEKARELVEQYEEAELAEAEAEYQRTFNNDDEE